MRKASPSPPGPTGDETKIATGGLEMAVRINGKTRGRGSLPAGSDQAEVLEAVRGDDRLKGFLDRGRLQRVIFVPDRLVNLVLPGSA